MKKNAKGGKILSYKLTLHCKFGPSKPKKGLIHQNLEESAKKVLILQEFKYKKAEKVLKTILALKFGPK